MRTRRPLHLLKATLYCESCGGHSWAFDIRSSRHDGGTWTSAHTGRPHRGDAFTLTGRVATGFDSMAMSTTAMKYICTQEHCWQTTGNRHYGSMLDDAQPQAVPALTSRQRACRGKHLRCPHTDQHSPSPTVSCSPVGQAVEAPGGWTTQSPHHPSLLPSALLACSCFNVVRHPAWLMWICACSMRWR